MGVEILLVSCSRAGHGEAAETPRQHPSTLVDKGWIEGTELHSEDKDMPLDYEHLFLLFYRLLSDTRSPQMNHPAEHHVSRYGCKTSFTIRGPPYSNVEHGYVIVKCEIYGWIRLSSFDAGSTFDAERCISSMLHHVVVSS